MTDQKQSPPQSGEETELEQEEISIESMMAQRDDYLDQLRRSRADYQNLSRRIEQDRTRAREFATRGILTQLLPAVDDLQRAMASVPDADRETSWVQGVSLIERKLAGLLEREGVKAIEALGQPFDPAFHEAVASDATGAKTVVIEVYQTGYKQGEQVLRPAMVKVGDYLEPSA